MKMNGIIGAGIAGIELAKKLEDAFIIEKSRGVGGRVAARRLGSYSIDHGGTNICTHADIKQQAPKFEIHQSWEASHLEIDNLNNKKIISTDGRSLSCKNLYITAPAPQAKALLERSKLEANFLNDVKYSSVIQFMMLSQTTINTEELNQFFDLVKTQQVSEDSSLFLFENKSEYLPMFIEMEKEEIKNFCLNLLSASPYDCHCHKWRYSQVTHSIPAIFKEQFAQKGVFLRGDYFS